MGLLGAFAKKKGKGILARAARPEVASSATAGGLGGSYGYHNGRDWNEDGSVSQNERLRTAALYGGVGALAAPIAVKGVRAYGKALDDSVERTVSKQSPISNAASPSHRKKVELIRDTQLLNGKEREIRDLIEGGMSTRVLANGLNIDEPTLIKKLELMQMRGQIGDFSQSLPDVRVTVPEINSWSNRMPPIKRKGINDNFD